MEKTIKILATPEIRDLAKSVYNQVVKKDSRFAFGDIEVVTFTSKEFKPKIVETVRNMDVYLFHSLYYPDPSTAFMRLLLSIDALSRASVNKIHLVLPYMTFLRQDRKDEPRVPISARLIATLIETNPKVEHVLTFDLHSDQAQGFFKIPLDNLYGSLVLKNYFEKKYAKKYANLIVVSPDHGGVVRARRFARYLSESLQIGIIDKRRSGAKANIVETFNYIGPSVKGKDVVLYDDMIDTGGSIISAIKMLTQKGARTVYACATHGIFSAPNENESAEDNLKAAGIKVIVTDSIPRTQKYCEKNKNWLTVIPLAEILSQAVYESASITGSVSRIFPGK